MSRSKFSGIKFPFYGLKALPYHIKYSNKKVICNFRKDHRYFLIDKIDESTKDLSYLERLALVEDRVEFDYTCRNLTELINSSSKWGVDNSGRIFDLSTKERFTLRVKSIRKVKPGLIWLNRISYPIHIDKTIKLEEVDTKVVKAIVVYIDNTWVLYRVTYNNSRLGESILL